MPIEGRSWTAGVAQSTSAREPFLQLPGPGEDEVALLEAMRALLHAEISAAGGALPFDRYMELALYAPALGYYVNGRRKFGEGGDFVTAPELSPVFGQCLAGQVAECLRAVGGGELLELGAGSGRLAVDLLGELARRDCLPRRYLILELSPSLQAAQRELLAASLPDLLPRVTWLDSLPPAGFRGVVVANELLDAMPVHRFRAGEAGWQELFVVETEAGLADSWRPLASPGLATALAQLWPDPDRRPAPGYTSEINLRLSPWLAAMAEMLQAGTLLLIDYGYTRREYYHPERNQGTLICHYRHRAYADPYLLPGLQDMTANVDFSAVAGAATAAGFALAGFTTQAHFLIDSGLDEILEASDPGELRAHLQLAQGVKKLTLPSEMGERFKVIALTRAVDAPLSGFRSRDLRARL
jgi:SAM-dependent MidA family methyltransferase